MASTRNKNNVGNYALEKQSYRFGANYIITNTQHQHPKLAGNGLIQGPMAPTYLATNAIDIESFLRGIRSTDLNNISNNNDMFLSTHPVLNPELTTLNHYNMFRNEPVLMPSNFQPLENQRPNLY
jgi:hypothetical protein